MALTIHESLNSIVICLYRILLKRYLSSLSSAFYTQSLPSTGVEILGNWKESTGAVFSWPNDITLMKWIYLIFIVVSAINSYWAYILGDNAKSRVGNIDYINELEALMARVAILVLIDYPCTQSSFCIFVKK